MPESDSLSLAFIRYLLSYEDPDGSQISLYTRTQSKKSLPGIYFQWGKKSCSYHPIFLLDDLDVNGFFSLSTSSNLTNFIKRLAYPEMTNHIPPDALFISNLAWFKSFIVNLRASVGDDMFGQLMGSQLIKLIVSIHEKKPFIALSFVKHSTVLNKNVHYTVILDLSFKFVDIYFNVYTYVDNKQHKNLSRFDTTNKLKAFYILFNYYSNIDVYNHLVGMLDIDTDLDDSNLETYKDIISMITI